MNAPLSTAWPPELALELALGLEDEAAICARYGIDHDALNALLCTPAFQAQLTQYRRDLHENGEIFRAKARMQAELLLDKSFRLINDPATPANVKAQIINTAAYGYNTSNITATGNISSAYNTLSAGPITINSGITVTVNTGAFWTIV